METKKNSKGSKIVRESKVPKDSKIPVVPEIPLPPEPAVIPEVPKSTFEVLQKEDPESLGKIQKELEEARIFVIVDHERKYETLPFSIIGILGTTEEQFEDHWCKDGIMTTLPEELQSFWYLPPCMFIRTTINYTCQVLLDTEHAEALRDVVSVQKGRYFLAEQNAWIGCIQMGTNLVRRRSMVYITIYTPEALKDFVTRLKLLI